MARLVGEILKRPRRGYVWVYALKIVALTTLASPVAAVSDEKLVVYLRVFSRDAAEPVEEGSGFIVSPNGYIVTSLRVAREAQSPGSRLTVAFRYKANHQVTANVSPSCLVVGGLPDACIVRVDVRVIAAQGIDEFPSLECRNLEGAESVVALGYAAGTNNTLFKIPVQLIAGLDQHETYPVNVQFEYGMGGGPVIDQGGKVIGVIASGRRGETKRNFTPLWGLSVALSSANIPCRRPERATDIDASFRDLMRRADLNLMNQQYAAAYDLYKDASDLLPARPEPIVGLASASFSQGNYTDAARFSRKAFQLKVPPDYSFLANVALSEEAMGDLPAALKTRNEVLEKTSPESSLHTHSVFSKGQILLKLSLLQEGAGDRARHLQQAEDSFRRFLDLKGSPAHFAYYHLACVAAMRGDRKSGTANLASARALLHTFTGAKAAHHRMLMSEMLNLRSRRIEEPGDPVRCPAIHKITGGRSRSSTSPN